MSEHEPLVIITSKAHAPRMRAHKILLENNYPHWLFVVDNVQQVQQAADAGVPVSRIHCTNRPQDIPQQDGIAWTRQWIERELVPLNSWYVSLDDNVGDWTWLPEPWYSLNRIDFNTTPNSYPEAAHLEAIDRKWRQLYETSCPFPTVVELWRELISACEAAGTQAGGFAIENNFFFRGNKWQRHGYVRAQNAVWKNTGLPFYYWPGAMLEDFVRSVDVVVRCGSVLINRFVKPQKQFFEAGGIGTFEERRPNLVACCKELMLRYPGLLKEVKGRDYSLTFATRNISEWRAMRDHLERTGAK